MAEAQQGALFTQANTDRVEREKNAVITVIIGNPPNNLGQKSLNENKENRAYKVIDHRIRETYSKDSKASSRSKLDDPYVKFLRWATDRLGSRDGILCFVSNNGFLDQVAFDGMRKHLAQDFQRIDHLDLHGNVRRNPKLSGTTHNVFGIQVGVGIKELARLRVEYESLKPWPLECTENKDVPYSERVTKMKLSPDKQSIAVNQSLTLADIPPETFEYRLGSRSALDWVIDQYQVKGESDPNREDDPDYIVQLVGQVVRVSVETVRIVKGLPDYR